MSNLFFIRNMYRIYSPSWCFNFQSFFKVGGGGKYSPEDMFFHWFLEKVEGREGAASWTLPNWRPGSNLQPRYMPLTGSWTQDPLVLGHTPTTEPHQPGHIFIFLTVSFEEQKIQLLIKSNYQCLILWLRFFVIKKLYSQF